MKSKTIEKIITKHLENWFASISDSELVKSLYKDVIVTGGCITSMFLDEEVNDFDIYIKDKDTAKKLAEYYTEMYCKDHDKTYSSDIVQETDTGISIEIPDATVESTDDKESDEWDLDLNMLMKSAVDLEKSAYASQNRNNLKFKPLHVSQNAITLTYKIQIITRFTGNPEIIHKNFDFIHTRNYFTFDDGLVLKKKALEAILTKNLVYVGSKFPICSVIRTRKFIERGWSINAGQYLKMVLQIGQLDLNNPKTLTDQLIGVDTFYFLEVIRGIKEASKKENKDGVLSLDNTEIMKIIDKIF